MFATTPELIDDVLVRPGTAEEPKRSSPRFLMYDSSGSSNSLVYRSIVLCAVSISSPPFSQAMPGTSVRLLKQRPPSVGAAS